MILFSEQNGRVPMEISSRIVNEVTNYDQNME